ncbi:hypothetical protein DFH09DRAFT_1446072 [Mycena vulgaris]|nr:hypothetical protein DFH09DRAFT_1446072 [Mycena vulgaris]
MSKRGAARHRLASSTMGAPYVCMQWVRRTHDARRRDSLRTPPFLVGVVHELQPPLFRTSRDYPSSQQDVSLAAFLAPLLARNFLRGALSDEEGAPWWAVPRRAHASAPARGRVGNDLCAHGLAPGGSGAGQAGARWRESRGDARRAGGSGGAEQPILPLDAARYKTAQIAIIAISGIALYRVVLRFFPKPARYCAIWADTGQDGVLSLGAYTPVEPSKSLARYGCQYQVKKTKTDVLLTVRTAECCTQRCGNY